MAYGETPYEKERRERLEQLRKKQEAEYAAKLQQRTEDGEPVYNADVPPQQRRAVKGQDTRKVIDESNVEDFLEEIKNKDPKAPEDKFDRYVYAQMKYSQWYNISKRPDELNINYESDFDFDEYSDVPAGQMTFDSNGNEIKKNQEDKYNWFTGGIRRGLNHTMVGELGKYGSGEYFMDVDDDDPGLAEEAVSFVTSMVGDAASIALVVGTAGMAGVGAGAVGGGSLLATSAGKQISRKSAVNYYKNNLINKAVTQEMKRKSLYGSVSKKKLTQTLGQKGVLQSAKEQSVKKLFKDKTDQVIISNIIKNSDRVARQAVTSTMMSKEFFKKGVKKGVFSKTAISAPHWSKITKYFGTQSAKTLAAYMGSGALIREMNAITSRLIDPETGQPYGDKAPNLVQRWMKNGFNMRRDVFGINWGEVVAASLEGFIGGYMAGGLQGLNLAGKAGALDSIPLWKKFLRGRPKAQNFTKDAMLRYAKGGTVTSLLSQSMAFSLGSEVAKPLHRGLGGGYKYLYDGDDFKTSEPYIDPTPFAKKLFKNTIFFGAHRAFNKSMQQSKKGFDVVMEELNGLAAKRNLKRDGMLDKLKVDDADNTRASEINEQIKKDTAKTDKIREDLNVKATDKYAEIKQLYDKTDLSNKDIYTIKKKIDQFTNILEEFANYDAGIPAVQKTYNQRIGRFEKVLNKRLKELEKLEERDIKQREKIVVEHDKKQGKNDKRVDVDSNSITYDGLQKMFDKFLMDREGVTFKGQVVRADKKLTNKDRELLDGLETTSANEVNHTVNTNLFKIALTKETGAKKSISKEIGQEIKGFAKWLDKKTDGEKNLFNANADDLKNYYYESQKVGRAFPDAIKRFGKATSDAREQTWDLKVKDYTQHPDAKQRSTTVLQPNEIFTYIDDLQNYIINRQTGGIMGDGFTAISSGKSVSNPTAQVVNFLWMQNGSRNTAISSNKAGNQFIKLKDIVPYGKKGDLLLTTTEKASAATGKRKKVEILFPDFMENMGYNPGKILKDLVIKRKTEVEAIAKSKGLRGAELKKMVDDAPWLITRATKDKVQGRPFNYDDMASFVTKFTSGKITPHKNRHSLLQAAIGLDRIRIENGKKPKYTEFVDVALLNHDANIGMSVIGSKFYSGDKTVYSPEMKSKLRREFFNDMKANEGQLVSKKAESTLVEQLFNKNKDVGQRGIDAPPKVAKKQLILDNRKRFVMTEEQKVNEIKQFIMKNKNATIKEEAFVGQEYAGKLVGDVISFVRKNMDATTLFHENIHAINRFNKEIGNTKGVALWKKGEQIVKKWALSNKSQRDRYKEFEKEYGKDKAPDEFLTQIGAEWGADFKAARGFKKVGMWVQEYVSQMKNFLGRGGALDIAREFGKQSRQGFARNVKEAGTNLKSAFIQRDKYQKIFKKEATVDDPLTNITKREITDEMKKMKIVEGDGIFNTIKATLRLNKDIDIQNLTEVQGRALVDFMRQVEVGAGGLMKKTKSHRSNIIKAQIIRKAQLGLSDANHQMILKHIGIRGGTLKKSTAKQAQAYLSWVSKLDKGMTPREHILNERSVLEFQASDKSGIFRGWERIKQLALSSDAILRSMGKNGAKIADKKLDHFQTEANLFGYGNLQIKYAQRAIKKYMGKKRFITGYNDKFIADRLRDINFIIDPAMGEGLKMSNASIKFMKDYKNNPNGNAAQAVKSIQEMYNTYWNAMHKSARKFMNSYEYSLFQKSMSPKYVTEYFTRQINAQSVGGNQIVMDYYNVGKPGHDIMVRRIQNQIIKGVLKRDFGEQMASLKAKMDASKSETTQNNYKVRLEKVKSQMAKRENELRNAQTGVGKQIYEDAATQALTFIHKIPTNASNKFLLKRMPKLPNITEIEGKKYNTYELNPEKLLGRYIRTMSKNIATMEHFPEFSSHPGKFSLKTMKYDKDGNITEVHAGAMSPLLLGQLAKSSYMGRYAINSLFNQLGLNPADPLSAIGENLAASATRYSALWGLSSFTSGLKNFAIGNVMTLGAFGHRAFVKGLIESLNQKNRDEVVKLGAHEIGVRDLELSGIGKFWMEKVSHMSTAEAANRIIAVMAGRHQAKEYADLIGGRGSFVFRKIRMGEAEAQLKTVFRLNAEEINFARTYGLNRGAHGLKGKRGQKVDKEIQRIMDKVAHESHIRTQGATADPFTPQWMQSGYGQSATLFYRMAYAGTVNLKNNIIAPALRGNIFPMVRYSIAANFVGDKLWDFYAWALGQNKPIGRDNDDFLDSFLVNGSKIEMLGLYSFLINPYSVGMERITNSNDMLFQPAIIRNIISLTSFTLGGLQTVINPASAKSKPLADLAEELVQNVVVFSSHAEKVAEKQRNPNKAIHKNLSTLKKTWSKKNPWYEKEGNVEVKSNKYRTRHLNMLREAWLNEDYKTFERYYWATWYSIYDENLISLQAGGAMVTTEMARRQAHQALNRFFDTLNPFYLPDNDENKAFSKYQHFKNYVSGVDKEIFAKAEKLETQYKRNRRVMVKKLRETAYKDKSKSDYFDGGKILGDNMWMSPYGSMFGIPKSLEWGLKKSRKEKVSKKP